MELTVNTAIRSRLASAIRAILDNELHERLWLQGRRLTPAEESFEDVVLFVIDELATSDPKTLVGHVLLDEGELEAFQRLSGALESLVDSIEPSATFAEVDTAGSIWRECISAASELRDRMRA